MATVTVKTTGFTEWRAALAKAGADLDRQVAMAEADAVAAMVERARPFHPPRGGAGALAGGLLAAGGTVIRRSDLRPERSLFPLPSERETIIDAALGRALDRLASGAGL